jgi:hypothetical protein
VSENEGFAGSLKVAGILGSFIAALLSDGDSKIGEQKAPRIPATFQFLKIGTSSRVGLAETIQSTHWKKSPTYEMIHRFSTPVQSKSTQTPQSPPKTHSKIKCFSRKTLDSILEKFQSKLACFSEISAEKNWILLDDSKADKNIPNCSLTQLANWSVICRLDSSIF